MRNYNYYLLLTLLLTFGGIQSLFGQFQKTGKYTDLEGRKHIALFEYLNPSQHINFIQVYDGDNKVELTAKDIKGFSLSDKEYTANSVKTFNYQKDYFVKTKGQIPERKDTDAFLKLVFNGRLSIYQYIDEHNYAHYFYKVKDEPLEELLYFKYEAPKSSGIDGYERVEVDVIKERKFYVNQLKEVAKRLGVKHSIKWSKLKYKEADLSDLALKFDLEDEEEVEEILEKKYYRNIVPSFNVYVGASFVKLRTGHPLFDGNDNTTNWMTKRMHRVYGFGVDIPLKYKNGLISIGGDLNRQTVVAKLVESRDFKLSYNYYSTSVHVKYNFTRKTIRTYVLGGIGYGSSSGGGILEDKLHSNEAQKDDAIEKMILGERTSFDLIGGIGVMGKYCAFEYRFQYGGSDILDTKSYRNDIKASLRIPLMKK